MPYLDLTHTFKSHMPVFPGDREISLVKVSEVEKNGTSDHRVETGMHVGTHMDAPAHMLASGKHLHEYAPEKFFGKGVIVDARGKEFADVDLLLNVKIDKGDIVLVCFGMGEKFLEKEYYEKYAEITEAFASKCVELEVSILGMDTPSPDRPPYSTHKILLNNDILIIENLTNLERLLKHKNFEIIALPIKFESGAAPCRVVAKLLL